MQNEVPPVGAQSGSQHYQSQKPKSWAEISISGGGGGGVSDQLLKVKFKISQWSRELKFPFLGALVYGEQQ